MAHSNRGPLKLNETRLILQARIEGLCPQQLLLRDAIVNADVGMTHRYATEFAGTLQPGIAGLWMERIRQAPNPMVELERLVNAQVDHDMAQGHVS